MSARPRNLGVIGGTEPLPSGRDDAGVEYEVTGVQAQQVEQGVDGLVAPAHLEPGELS